MSADFTRQIGYEVFTLARDLIRSALARALAPGLRQASQHLINSRVDLAIFRSGDRSGDAAILRNASRAILRQ